MSNEIHPDLVVYTIYHPCINHDYGDCFEKRCKNIKRGQPRCVLPSFVASEMLEKKSMEIIKTYK